MCGLSKGVAKQMNGREQYSALKTPELCECLCIGCLARQVSNGVNVAGGVLEAYLHCPVKSTEFFWLCKNERRKKPFLSMEKDTGIPYLLPQIQRAGVKGSHKKSFLTMLTE